MVEAGKSSVFLSYARGDDEAFVHRLWKDLTDAGFKVWFDRVCMPARQLTFYQEIRDAISACDHLILVIGPAAVRSSYVEQEWRFALEAGKCIHSVVRRNGEQINGYDLLPEELKLIHAEDFRDDTQFPTARSSLIRQLGEPLARMGALLDVPALPPHYRLQRERLHALCEQLLSDLRGSVVISGEASRLGIQGMGGIGKSILAAALARNQDVRRAFPDGIVWIRLGQQPNVIEALRQALRALGEPAAFEDIRSGRESLRAHLENRAVLLIVDDVWQRSHVDPFDVCGIRSRLLLTTRDNSIATAIAASSFNLQLPDTRGALALLAAAARVPSVDQLPALAYEVAEECGRLPLALALCGSMVAGAVSWKDLLDALRERDLEFIATEHAIESQHANVWRAIDVSIQTLSPEERKLFAEFSVFPQDEAIPEAAVVTLWSHTGQLSGRQARRLLATFHERAMIQLDRSRTSADETGFVTLHDLLHDFATRMASQQFGSSLEGLHAEFLAAYADLCPNGWPSGPRDGYFFRHLRRHLIGAKRREELANLLRNIEWLETKSRRLEGGSTASAAASDLLEDFAAVLNPTPADGLVSSGDARKERTSEEPFLRYLFQLIRANYPTWLGLPARLYPQLYPFLNAATAPDGAAKWLAENFDRCSSRGVWFRQLSPPAGSQSEIRLSIPVPSELPGPVAFSGERPMIFAAGEKSFHAWHLTTGREELFQSFAHDAVLLRERKQEHDLLILLRNGELYSLRDRTGVESLPGPGVAISCADFCPRRNVLALATPWGHLGIWDPVSGKWLARSTSSRASVRTICFDADGEHLLVARDTNVCFCFDAHTLKVLGPKPLLEPVLKAVAASSMPGWYIGCLNGDLKCWGPGAEEPLALDSTGPYPVCALAHHGEVLLAGDTRGVVRCWGASTTRPFKGYVSFATGSVRAMATDGDLFAVGREGMQLQISSVGVALESESRWKAPVCTVPAWSSDSRAAMAGDTTGAFLMLPNPQGPAESVPRVARFNGAAAVATFAPIWVAATVDGIAVFDHARKIPLGYRNASGRTTAIAVHSSGDLTVSGHGGGVGIVWDTLSAGELGRISMHEGAVTALQFTNQMSRFVSAGSEGAIAVWEIEFRPAEISRGRGVFLLAGDSLGRSVLPGIIHRKVHTRVAPKADGDGISTLALSHAGEFLAFCTRGRLSLWTFPGLEDVAEFPAPEGMLVGLAFSPDDRYLLGVTEEAHCTVWGVEEQSVLCSFQASGPGIGCSWRPDGEEVAVVAGGSLNIFRLQGLAMEAPIVGGIETTADQIEVVCPRHASPPWSVAASLRGHSVSCPVCGAHIRVSTEVGQRIQYPHSEVPQ